MLVKRNPMRMYVVRTDSSSVDVCSNNLPQHNVEVSRLVSVKLEVSLGGEVDSVNSLR